MEPPGQGNEHERDRGDDEEESTAPQDVSFDAIGLSVRALSAAERKQLKIEKGVVVTDVKHFGEAFNRGLRTDDVIVEADKTPVASPKDLQSALGKRKSGDAVMLRVKRASGSAFIAVQIP